MLLFTCGQENAACHAFGSGRSLCRSAVRAFVAGARVLRRFRGGGPASLRGAHRPLAHRDAGAGWWYFLCTRQCQQAECSLARRRRTMSCQVVCQSLWIAKACRSDSVRTLCETNHCTDTCRTPQPFNWDYANATDAVGRMTEGLASLMLSLRRRFAVRCLSLWQTCTFAVQDAEGFYACATLPHARLRCASAHSRSAPMKGWYGISDRC